MSSLRRATALALLSLCACRSPATQVLLTIDTDIERPLEVSLVVFEGALAPSTASSRAHSRDVTGSSLGAPVGRFPIEVGLVPRTGSPREGALTAVLTVRSAATATAPAIDFDRPLQVSLVPGTRQDARVFLRFACGTPVSGCTSTSAPCTFAQRCNEMGRVCDDNGVCGSPIVEQVTHGSDAGSDAMDSARDVQIDAPNDVEAEAPLTDIAPRPLAPMSSSRVSSRRPTLRWKLPAGVTQSRIELCSDRPCANVLATIDASNESARAASELPTGWVFWRVRARSGARVGAMVSPTWQFWVPARSASDNRDTSYGSIGDFNGDGLADLVVGGGTSGGTGTGLVSIFNGRAGGISAAPSRTLVYESANGFGKAATSAGDVNGDGFADLIVGAWNYSSMSRVRSGLVLLFHGGPDGVASTPAITIEGSAVEERLGISVAGLGDVDGDGYGDVIAGGSGQNIPMTPSIPGIARLYNGGPSGVDPRSEVYWRMGQNTDWFGYDVNSLGDINGDGFADFSVSAPWADNAGLTDVGRALVVAGASGFSVIGPGNQATNGVWFNGLRASERFGVVHANGDLDNDGFSDVVFVGDGAATDARGRIRVLRGGAMGLIEPAQREFEGNAANDQLGFSGSMHGDLDNDGFDDLLLGACTAVQSGVASSGYALLYKGTSAGLDSAISHRWNPGSPYGGLFGFSVSIVGDLNGDRIADFAISEPYASAGGRAQSGRVHVGYGGTPIAAPSLTIDGPSAGVLFGYMIGR